MGHVISAKQLEQFLEKHGSHRFSEFMVLARAAPASQRTLTCPGCATMSYRAVRHDQVEIDVCASCMSVYFDAGEATLYLQKVLVRKFGADAAVETADGLEALVDLITDILS